MMRKLLVILCLLVMNGPVLAAEEPANYCDDAQGWQQWRELVAKYPKDDDIATAYALRIGLCQQIEEGKIASPRASLLFDRFMEAMKAATRATEHKEAKTNT